MMEVKNTVTDLISVDKKIDDLRDHIDEAVRNLTEVLQHNNKQLADTVNRMSDRERDILAGISAKLDNITDELSKKMLTGVSAFSVEVIEGIGSNIISKLRDVGINTLGDLVKASPMVISNVVGGTRAANFIAMAKLMVGTNGVVNEEAAEMIVLSTEIDTKEKLAIANANDVYTRCKDAVTTGKVKLPGQYTFTLEDVQRWINAAK